MYSDIFVNNLMASITKLLLQIAFLYFWITSIPYDMDDVSNYFLKFRTNKFKINISYLLNSAVLNLFCLLCMCVRVGVRASENRFPNFAIDSVYNARG